MKKTKLLVCLGASLALLTTPIVMTGCSSAPEVKKEEAAKPSDGPASAPMSAPMSKPAAPDSAPAPAAPADPAPSGGGDGGW